VKSAQPQKLFLLSFSPHYILEPFALKGGRFMLKINSERLFSVCYCLRIM